MAKAFEQGKSYLPLHHMKDVSFEDMLDFKYYSMAAYPGEAWFNPKGRPSNLSVSWNVPNIELITARHEAPDEPGSIGYGSRGPRTHRTDMPSSEEIRVSQVRSRLTAHELRQEVLDYYSEWDDWDPRFGRGDGLHCPPGLQASVNAYYENLTNSFSD